eukprot:gene9390-6609_t
MTRAPSSIPQQCDLHQPNISCLSLSLSFSHLFVLHLFIFFLLLSQPPYSTPTSPEDPPTPTPDEPIPPTELDTGIRPSQDEHKGPEMYVQDEDSSSIDEVAEERQVELQRRDETCCDKLSAVVATVIPAGSIVATIFSMCATAIGGGILGVPSAFANSGAVPGVLWLVGIALAGMYSLHLLALAAQTTGESSYERLATVLLGRGGRYFVAGMRLVNCVGSMIAYVMTIGNLIKPILEGANAPDFLLSGSGFKLVFALFLLVHVVVFKGSLFAFMMMCGLQVFSLHRSEDSYAGSRYTGASCGSSVWNKPFSCQEVLSFVWLRRIDEVRIRIINKNKQTNKQTKTKHVKKRFCRDVTLNLASGVAITRCVRSESEVVRQLLMKAAAFLLQCPPIDTFLFCSFMKQEIVKHWMTIPTSSTYILLSCDEDETSCSPVSKEEKRRRTDDTREIVHFYLQACTRDAYAHIYATTRNDGTLN